MNGRKYKNEINKIVVCVVKMAIVCVERCCVFINEFTSWPHLRMLSGAVNYVLLAEDVRIFFATTRETMVDVRSVSVSDDSGSWIWYKDGFRRRVSHLTDGTRS